MVKDSIDNLAIFFSYLTLYGGTVNLDYYYLVEFYNSLSTHEPDEDTSVKYAIELFWGLHEIRRLSPSEFKGLYRDWMGDAICSLPSLPPPVSAMLKSSDTSPDEFKRLYLDWVSDNIAELSLSIELIFETDYHISFSSLSDLLDRKFEGLNINIVEVVQKLEVAARVPYEPDTEPSKNRLIVYLLLAVPLALHLKKTEDYSENVRSLLEECGRVILWYEKYWSTSGHIEDNISELDDFSFYAASAMAMTELYRICHIDGKYDEALHWLAAAIQLGTISYEGQAIKLEVNADETAKTFELLQEAESARDWKQVSLDCYKILVHGDWSIDVEHFITHDSDGYIYYWSEFWARALGWSRSQLDPDQFRALMKIEERDQAVKRINTYLLKKDMWDMLSQRAQESLINADITWFRGGEKGGESILNAIRITMEEILYKFFWVPLCNWLDITPNIDISNMDFENIRAELNESGKKKYPALQQYERMLKTKGFKNYFLSLEPTDTAKNHILKELPDQVKALRKLRRDAEHEPERVWKRSEIEPVFKRFLGLDCRGVIPKLLDTMSSLHNRRDNS